MPLKPGVHRVNINASDIPRQDNPEVRHDFSLKVVDSLLDESNTIVIEYDVRAVNIAWIAFGVVTGLSVIVIVILICCILRLRRSIASARGQELASVEALDMNAPMMSDRSRRGPLVPGYSQSPP
jgi:hypothetical protein